MKRLMLGAVAMVLLFSTVACGRGNDDIQSMIVGKTYVYEKEGCGGDFTIDIKEDGTFTYYEGMLSSYLGAGSWALEDGTLVLSDNEKLGYSFANYFRVEEDALVFLAEKSSNFLYVKVADGERFTSIGE